MAHWNITQLTELKVQFLLEKCKVYFKVKYLPRVSISVFCWFISHVYIILFCAFALVFKPPTCVPQPHTCQQLREDPSFDRISVCERLPNNFLFFFSLLLLLEILALLHNLQLRQALVQRFYFLHMR